MSDYSFMQTGNNQNTDQKRLQETIVDVASMVVVFTEDAIKLAELYVQHSNRTIIAKNDIAKALKVRSYCGDTFWNLPNVQERLQNAKEFIVNNLDEDDEELDTTNDFEQYTDSPCNCEICIRMKQINQQWNLWNPQTPMDNILKNAIDKASD